MDKVLKEDIESFRLPQEIAGRLSDSAIIVTGATGLIGGMFVRCLDAAVGGIRWILPVRNAEKARKLLAQSPTPPANVEIIEADLADFFRTTEIKADYIVHCASPTNGAQIASRPAETFLLAIESTKAALDYARRNAAKGMVYVSSLEYYGQRHDDAPVYETMTGIIDHSSPRSSYPLGKQAAEYLCLCYAGEYGVRTATARLTQTFGAGVNADDNRVFAQFARSVIAGRDIELHTEGLSAKPYCYTTDCMAALAFILTKGNPGEAYNVATPGTYVSIRGLAEIFRDISDKKINVRIRPRDCGYAPETRLNLDPDKIIKLGWTPRYGLADMAKRLVESMRLNNDNLSSLKHIGDARQQ